MKHVIESAEPVLSWKPVKGGFGRYIKGWRIRGYSWDGSCMCTKASFWLIVPVHKLEVTEKELIDAIR